MFIVAADRAVLETAVAKHSRQETPYNPQNPYDSAGSSYLDKIFQYQWQLPPMMPSSLSRFAESLVKDRTDGLWREVNAGEVVSVLVPMHVQSPRRVKELLDTYAMAYRITERTICSGSSGRHSSAHAHGPHTSALRRPAAASAVRVVAKRAASFVGSRIRNSVNRANTTQVSG